MVEKFFSTADEREHQRPGGGSRRGVSSRALRLYVLAAIWLLGAVAAIAFSGCWDGQTERNVPDQAEQTAPNRAVQETMRQDRIKGLLDAAEELDRGGLTGPVPEEKGGDFKYKVVEGKVVITMYENTAAAELNIPAEIAGKPVVRLGKGMFIGCDNLRTVTIPGSVTNIAAGAFVFSEGLTTVRMGDSVKTIGNRAFFHCKNLKSITVPESVASIGPGAFAGCGSLASITVAPGNTSFRSVDGVLFSKDGKTILGFPAGKKVTQYTIPGSVTSIANRTFSGCAKLKEVTIGDSVTSIEGWAFEDCESLTTMTIPDSVTHIGECAFSNCTSLTAISLPDSVTSIESGMFSSCTSLAAVTIPKSVTDISEGAFDECTSLTSISLAQGNTSFRSVDGILFSKDGKTILAFPAGRGRAGYTIPDSVTSIGASAFSGCHHLTTVTIGDSVTSIGEGAFWRCTRLTGVTIGDSVTDIGDHSFFGCVSLNRVKIGDSVANIGMGAFSGCESLTSVTIPGSVADIGEGAFYGCTNLTKVTIPHSAKIAPDAFEGCPWQPPKK